jgi:Flp pilus assembly protein TadG
MVKPMIRKLLLKRAGNPNCQRGQSVVELALVTPLLLVALAIPFDFGIALFMANLTQNAAREGTRIGAELQKTGGSDPNFNYTTTEATTVKNAVLSRMPNSLTNKTVNVKFYEGTAPTCVEYVQVTAQGNYNFFLYQLLRQLGFGAPNSILISRTTQMRYTYQPFDNTAPCSTTSVNQNYTS